MLLFWTAAALLSAAAAAVVLWRARGAGETLAEAPEAAVYRRHLAEQDELKARGLLGEAEYQAARAEAARRLLAVAAPEDVPVGDPKKLGLVVLGSALAAAALAVGIYTVIGSPGAQDRPFAARLAGWEETARTNPAALGPAESAVVLAAMARRQPNSGEVWSFLGRARAAAGDTFGAAQAFEKAVALRPNSADDWSALGEVLTELNDGRLGPDAERAFRRALAIEPNAPGPRYGMGRAEIAAGRRAEGLKLWREALALLPADDPRREALRREIAAAEGASAAAPPAQEEAIRGMVQSLAARLEAAPDDPQGWARLVRSYTVLNDLAARDRALARARQLFRDRPADLAAIEAAAR